MTFSVRIKRSAAREIAVLDRRVRERIVAAIDSLAIQPYRGQSLKGELTGLRRLRVGDYRIVYEVRRDEVDVLEIRVAHRSDVYRRH